MKKVLVGAILFFVLTVALSAQETNFKIKTIDNSRVELKELYSKGAVLVNFWALWCKPCRAEIKFLEKYYTEYKSKGFSIIGINQDSPRSLAKVKTFVNSHNLTFPIVLDPNQEIFQKFNGQSVPFSVLLNKKGEIVYTHIGYLPGDEIELENEILKLVE